MAFDYLAEPVDVLHVDDDRSLAKLAAVSLERADERLSVETCHGASEALDRLDTGDFDCVVSDYDMPGRNGVELLEAVRQRHGALPFVLFTGKGSEEVASDAISAGVTDYLQKDAGSEQYELLANRCLNAVRRYEAEQQATELDRVRGVVKRVNGVLVRADEREALAQQVCAAITDAEPYQLAWIGHRDPDTGRVVPRASAGDAAESLEAVEMPADDGTGEMGPTERALVSGELQVAQDLRTVSDDDPWRDSALENGFGSCAAVPLVHEGERHGVLSVYTDSHDAFDETERDLLCELGDNIAHAMHALEIRDDLRASSAQLGALFEHSPDMINIHDSDGTIVTANPRACEMLGYEEHELRGMSVWEIDETVDRESATEIWRTMDVGERLELEGSYRRRDGATFPVEIHVQRLEFGGETQFVVVSRDISERKTQQQKREAVISRVTDAVVQVDSDWRFTMVDDRAEELYGMAETDLLGRRFWDVFEQALGTRFEDEYRHVMQTREPTSFEAYYDGLDGWFAVQAYPDDDGGVSFYFRDITDRKEREQELAEERRRYSTLVERSHDGVVILQDDVFAFANPRCQEILGYEESELVGKPFLDVVAPDDRPLVQRRYEQRLDEGGAPEQQYEMRVERKDGETRVIEVSAASIQHEGDPAALVTIRDVTRRNEYEERLEEMTEKLEAVNRVIRHDIRNDMTVVLGWAEILEDHVDDAGQEHLQKLLASGEHIFELTEIARDYIETLTTDDDIALEPTSVRSVLDAELDLRRETFPDAEFAVRGEIPDVQVTANEMLGSVFRNVLNNAVQHNTRSEPAVEIDCDVSESAIVLRFADNGPGIPDVAKESVFGKGESSLDAPGTGIGLYLVDTLVGQYDGRVWITDNDPVGTVIAVELPRAD